MNIELSVLDCGIRVECADRQAAFLLNSTYRWFKQPIKSAQVTYQVSRFDTGGELLFARNGARRELARDDGDFLYMFEKDMTIETQKLRSDLFFVHAAALEMSGRGLALVAPSGYGKSTTTWGLMHHGFKYLSDELAPIELTTMQVHPYPHALCLKAAPPADYPLPNETIYTTYTAHVATEWLPCETLQGAIPLEAIFFVRFVDDFSKPILQPLEKAEAAIRLFTNSLNPLAHTGDGLDGAIAIVSSTRCFELVYSDLTATCELIKATFLSILS